MSRPGSHASARWGKRLTPFLHAVRLRCPHCGGRPIFVSWVRLLPNCPTCGLDLERGEQGYWVGAYFFNLMAVETIFAVWVTGVLYFTWPSPPWLFLQLTTLGLMLASPFLCFPFSKTLFLAFDLVVRPPSEEDFVAPHEAVPHQRPS